LELDLTESLLAENVDVNGAMLNELSMHIGLKLSIEDFGTGYSLFALLPQALPARRPEAGPVVHPRRHNRLRRIGLAHDLRPEVIAEGVQNEEQRACLREYGCDRVQGYYFSEPLPAQDFSELPKREKVLLSVSTRG
jgi:EAL domain-containing protein (putative c-di-GMP-specific phosphodiesterase class I)